MLTVEALSKTYATSSRHSKEQVGAVKTVSFEVGEGELFTLLGPSGCGKTTTLRCIAGLENPDSGEIKVADRVVYSSSARVRVAASDRRLGVVFQSYAIWPHMTVFKNAAFPLQVLPRRERPRKAEIQARVERVLAAVQLDAVAGRPATDLSGGQQQRLALARALILEPPLMLLDEPLSNLDAKLREGMRLELKRLQSELNITTVYVTHDQVEALAMSTTVGVMNGGVLEQVAPPRAIYQNPSSRFVADFVGASNFLEGVVAGVEGSDVVVHTPAGDMLVAGTRAKGDKVLISTRPEQVTLCPSAEAPAPGRETRWQGIITSTNFLGDAVDYLVRVGESADIRVRANPSAVFSEGDKVTLAIPADLPVIVPVGP
jgi:iron(III) transport system ATP-binding protein